MDEHEHEPTPSAPKEEPKPEQETSPTGDEMDNPYLYVTESWEPPPRLDFSQRPRVLRKNKKDN